MFHKFSIYLLKNDANFTKLISDIRIEMQYKMVDDHNAQTSYVKLFSSVYVVYIYLFRTLENEQKNSINENMLKKYDVFFILVMLTYMNLKIWFIYKIGISLLYFTFDKTKIDVLGFIGVRIHLIF